MPTGLVNPQGGYPIVGLNWMVMYKDQDSDSTAASLKAVADWILTTGQTLNQDQWFAAIDPDVAAMARAAVDRNL